MGVLVSIGKADEVGMGDGLGVGGRFGVGLIEGATADALAGVGIG